MSQRPWYEESMLSAGATRDPEKRRQYEEHIERCRAAMPRSVGAPALTYPVKQGEPPEKGVVENKKPTLLDIARRAMLEDRTAETPWDLIITLKANWFDGAKAIGLSIITYSENTPAPPELRAWLNAKEERDWGGLLLKAGRKLGDIVELKGRQLVLIANLQDASLAAFVPAEEIDLSK